MAIDQDTYAVEGYQDVPAEHGVRIEEIEVTGDDEVELTLGAMLEPSDKDDQSSQIFEPSGAIYVNNARVGETPELAVRSGFYDSTTFSLSGVNSGDNIRFEFPDNWPDDEILTDATLEVQVPSMFDPNDVDVSCQMSTDEVYPGDELIVILTITNGNEEYAEVEYEVEVGDMTESGTEVVDDNATRDVEVLFDVDLDAGEHDVDHSISASEW